MKPPVTAHVPTRAFMSGSPGLARYALAWTNFPRAPTSTVKQIKVMMAYLAGKISGRRFISEILLLGRHSSRKASKWSIDQPQVDSKSNSPPMLLRTELYCDD